MKVLDPGHDYLLDSHDGGEPIRLTFVKRDDPPEKYPGNVGHYPGTIMQEVFRALIDRCKYVDNQIPCSETETVLNLQRLAICELEQRVRRTREQPRLTMPLEDIEFYSPCAKCGHILCLSHTA